MSAPVVPLGVFVEENRFGSSALIRWMNDMRSGFSSSGSPEMRAAAATGETVTSLTFASVAGLSVPLTVGTWIFEILLNGQSSTTAGAQSAVAYSGTVTSLDYEQVANTSGTATAAVTRVTAVDTAAVAYHTTANTEGVCRMQGQIVVADAGNFVVRAEKVTAGNYIIRASSWMRAIKVA